MKIILDANVFISYLLASEDSHTIPSLVESCFANPSIEIIAPHEVFKELTGKVAEKKYLQTHILQEDLDELVDIISSIAIIPASLSSVPTISSDPDDDYLLAYGVMEEVDYIITGDKALLALKEFEEMRIVDPRSFLALLEELLR